MPYRYQSGEEIRKGDQVLFHGEPGYIEFVADPLHVDPEAEWYVEQYGGGVMVVEPKKFGRAFLTDMKREEDLELISRLADSVADGKRK